MPAYLFQSTISGHNYELARFIQDHCAGHLTWWPNSAALPPLTAADCLIIVPATTGAGEPSDTGRQFAQALLAAAPVPAAFWVCGIGDAGYGADFAGAVTFFDQLLAQTGGRRLLRPLKLDYELDQANQKRVLAALAKLEGGLNHA